MKLIKYQIPLSTDNWLQNTISNLPEKIFIPKAHLSQIKTLNEKLFSDSMKDIIFQPFCMLYKLPQSKGSSMKNAARWSTSAKKIISLPSACAVIESYNKDGIEEEEALRIYEILNRSELSEANVAKISNSLVYLVMWYRALLGYHISSNPYIIRNNNGLFNNKEVEAFANIVSKRMTKFYKLKSFIIKIGALSKEFTYGFNLSNLEVYPNVPQKRKSLADFKVKVLINIIKYLTIEEALQIKCVFHNFYESVYYYIDTRIIEVLAAVELEKMMNKAYLGSSLAILYDFGILCPNFLVLEHCLHKSENFFNRALVGDIKSLKKTNGSIQLLCQCACIIFNKKPFTVGKPDGTIVKDYFKPVLDMMFKMEFMDSVNKVNVYKIPKSNILQVNGILKKNEILLNDEIAANINKGIYQLYLWIQGIVLIHKFLNPVMFLSPEYISHRFKPDIKSVLQRIDDSLEYFKLLFNRRNEGKLSNKCEIINLLGSVSDHLKSKYNAAEYIAQLGKNSKVYEIYFQALEVYN